ncbi:atlastin-3-like protein [Dinothrombium tinctorium]|uniref:Atlastin-3-like protein n=1 Tax=Dinothrombium tinctorium TaxID=1965070 RepID=A0A3S3PN62_9ACAR|nr:atlastin-3-like protein [Dinothrombium tinctorium]RWS13180.1 atlastin-3-like protein [Dinothrombium tinctorium]RWS13185.1 atlastin-3-like protein [Dinothrombium tinctorium]
MGDLIFEEYKREHKILTKEKISRKKSFQISGEGVQIVEFNEENDECIFNRKALENILLKPEFKKKPLVVISIVGPTSSGKTSFENYCFRFMERNGQNNWLGSDEEPLTGMDWKPTHRTVTRGIWVWNKPYIRKLSNGKECVVLFMDTEGLYGKDEIRGRWSHVFGISTAASSVQIFNLKEELTPRDMEELQVFVRLAELGIKADADQNKEATLKMKPFQKLWFLIRSWRYPEDYDYGEKGGKKYLSDVFEAKETDKYHLREMKQSIINAYQDIHCYLMPHPNDVIYKSSFKGQVGPLSEDFKQHLDRFIRCILEPENLVPKELIGISMTPYNYVDFFGSIIDTFNNGNFPKIESLMRAISLASKNQLIDYFTQLYKEMLICELDLALQKKPRRRGKLLHVFRVVNQDIISMYDNHPKFITSEEASQVKEKILMQMKVVRETVASDYSDKFVDYFRDLYEQLMDQVFLTALKNRVHHIDPEKLADLHTRLKIKLLSDVYSLSKVGIEKDIQCRIRRIFDSSFLKYKRNNDVLVEEMQGSTIKYATASGGGGLIGVTAGSIAAHAAVVTASASIAVSVVGGGLIVLGIGSVGLAGFLFYRWYKIRQSCAKAKQQMSETAVEAVAMEDL